MEIQGQKHFENIKEKVKAIFSSEKYKEVNRLTNYKLSGVYMIYIDCDKDDLIMPIYIGQSKNVQKRYKDHLTQLLSLNRLTYESYKEYFFSGKNSYYDGFFKTCKIFKYMIEKDCDLTKFRMKILVECEVEKLDYYEDFYIEEFLSSFLGFNQFESRIQANKLKWNANEKNENKDSDVTRFLKAIESDIEGVQKYYEYGFTKFNFEHAMPTDISYLLNVTSDNNTIREIERLQKELINLCETKIPGYFELLNLKNRLHFSLETKKEVVKEEEEFTVKLIAKIKNLLNTGLLEKSDSEALGRFLIKYEQGKIRTLDFFTHSFTKNLLEKHYNKDMNKLIQLRDSSIEARDSYFLDNEKRDDYSGELRKIRYELIFPRKPYDLFPLKSLTYELSPKIPRRTQIHIHFDLTNNGVMRSVIPKHTDVVRVLIFNTETGQQLAYYIDNKTTSKIKNDIFYIEKDFNNLVVFQKQRFAISSTKSDQFGPTLFIEDYDNSFISILSEYKHGINDYVIKNQSLYKLSSIFDKINEFTSEYSRIGWSCSESKNALNKALTNDELSKHPLLIKLGILS